MSRRWGLPLVFVVAGLAFWGGTRLASTPTRVQGTGPTEAQVRRLAKLVVLRVQLAEVIEGEKAGARLAVVVKGDCDLATDLGAARFLSKDPARQVAVIELPPPTPDRPRVDHDRTWVYRLPPRWSVFGTMVELVAKPQEVLLTEAMAAAQQRLEAVVNGHDYVDQARRHAESVIAGFFREAFDWTIEVRWSDGKAGSSNALVAAR